MRNNLAWVDFDRENIEKRKAYISEHNKKYEIIKEILGWHGITDNEVVDDIRTYLETGVWDKNTYELIE